MRLILVHSFDPRGPKVGGIETHVRQLLQHHPADMRVLMIGIDDFGDLELGKIHPIKAGGVEFDFVPIMHYASHGQTSAADSVLSSVTLRFAMAFLKYLPRLRKLVRGQKIAGEVERVEFAPLLRLLGCPFVQIFHNEGDPRTDKMDSILSRHWYVSHITEWIGFRLSSRIFCVTQKIRDRIAVSYPKQARKAEVLTVSVDTRLFRPTPFDLSSGKLKLVYAGRLDEFKDPPLMFEVARQLHAALQGKFEFHYCGSSDPHRFEEFRPIEPFTVMHGALTQRGVAEVMRKAHMGILVSYYEGMPCFLLELLASGRPFGGLRLPQFDRVVERSVSGRMVERAETSQKTASTVVSAILDQWEDIKCGKADPKRVHQKILPWSIDHQLDRLFVALRTIAKPGRSAVTEKRRSSSEKELVSDQGGGI
jgi:glycosyltransferase involved in cell wall biosynthesis